MNPGSTYGTQMMSSPKISSARAWPPVWQVSVSAIVAWLCMTYLPGTRWCNNTSTDGRWPFSGSHRALVIDSLYWASRTVGSSSSVAPARSPSLFRSIFTKPSRVIVASAVPLPFTYNRSPILHDVLPPPASTIDGSEP